MVTIIFESHGTTTDNEKHLASGWADVELSELGIRQSKEMGQRYADDSFDIIFCSDLRRSYESAEVGFGGKLHVIRDVRLNECNYIERLYLGVRHLTRGLLLILSLDEVILL